MGGKTKILNLVKEFILQRNIYKDEKVLKDTLKIIHFFYRHQMDIFFWNPFLPCINMLMIS